VLYIAAVTCPALVFRVVNSTDSGIGAVLNVSCPVGQKLITGHESTTASCSTTGKWVPEVPECVGERVYFATTCIFF